MARLTWLRLLAVGMIGCPKIGSWAADEKAGRPARSLSTTRKLHQRQRVFFPKTGSPFFTVAWTMDPIFLRVESLPETTTTTAV